MKTKEIKVVTNMSSVNRVILLGRLGKDPELKNFDNGGSIVNFTLATSEHYKDKSTGEKKEITDWHNISVRGQAVIIAQKHLHKGDLVYIEGKLRTRSWEKDGITRYVTEVIADGIQLMPNERRENQVPNHDVF